MAGGDANLAALLERRAARVGWGANVAFVVGDRAYTHDEVHAGAARASSLLAQLGVERGDRVLIVATDGIEFVWAFLGTVRLGAVAVPVNPRLTADDHRFLAGDTGARVIVTTPDLAARFAGAAGVVQTEGMASALDGHPEAPAAPVDLGAPAYAQYTSGTTGSPKAALHRHADPPVYFRAFAQGAIDVRPDDVMFSVSKMFFAYGLGNSLFFTLMSGCRAVLHPGPPGPADIAGLAEEHGVTVLYSVPTVYAHLVADGRSQAFSALRAAVSAGEALVPSLLHRARDFLGCPLLDGLGSTEVGQTFVSNTLQAWRDGTIGRPLAPYEVVVRDEAGRDLGPDEIGLLWVRGPTVLIGYLGRPDATAKVKDGEWLCTGDRAEISVDGFVSHRGRADDIEIVGGINVAPMEIEDVLSAHPAVTEAAVAGLRSTEGASRLEAFVVLSPGVAGGDALAAELVELARSRLAPHKVPRMVHFIDALPRTATGKLRRFLLRAGGAVPPREGLTRLPRVAGSKRRRNKRGRQGRNAAARAAQKRAEQRRWTIAIGVGAIAVLVGVTLITVLTSGDDSTEVESDAPTTTTPAVESAAGKPCVAMTSPLPPGAPAVPVKEGPPPAELVTEDLKVGDGPEVVKGATVTVNYIGVACSSGGIFDASYAGGEPATFPLDQVIPGWTNGIPGMKVGGQRLLGIPAEQAYGAQGQPPDIAPDEALWFVVEVLDAKPAGTG